MLKILDKKSTQTRGEFFEKVGDEIWRKIKHAYPFAVDASVTYSPFVDGFAKANVVVESLKESMSEETISKNVGMLVSESGEVVFESLADIILREAHDVYKNPKKYLKINFSGDSIREEIVDINALKFLLDIAQSGLVKQVGEIETVSPKHRDQVAELVAKIKEKYEQEFLKTKDGQEQAKKGVKETVGSISEIKGKQPGEE